MYILDKFKKEKSKKKETKKITEKKVKEAEKEVKEVKEIGEIKESKGISPASLIKHVWITEKAGNLVNLRQYTFIIKREANKPRIKKAVEIIYGVKVISVNIVNIKGKPRRMGRTLGRTSSYKKAIVTLKEGQKIDVMPT